MSSPPLHENYDDTTGEMSDKTAAASRDHPDSVPMGGGEPQRENTSFKGTSDAPFDDLRCNFPHPGTELRPNSADSGQQHELDEIASMTATGSRDVEPGTAEPDMGTILLSRPKSSGTPEGSFSFETRKQQTFDFQGKRKMQSFNAPITFSKDSRNTEPTGKESEAVNVPQSGHDTSTATPESDQSHHTSHLRDVQAPANDIATATSQHTFFQKPQKKKKKSTRRPQPVGNEPNADSHASPRALPTELPTEFPAVLKPADQPPSADPQSSMLTEQSPASVTLHGSLEPVQFSHPRSSRSLPKFAVQEKHSQDGKYEGASSDAALSPDRMQLEQDQIAATDFMSPSARPRRPHQTDTPQELPARAFAPQRANMGSTLHNARLRDAQTRASEEIPSGRQSFDAQNDAQEPPAPAPQLPEKSQSTRPLPQTRLFDNVHQNVADRGLHKVSQSRVSKSRPKKSQPTSLPLGSNVSGSAVTAVDKIFPVMRLLIHEEKTETAKKFDAERDQLISELHAALDAKLSTQNKLESIVQERDTLNNAIGKQKTQLATYNTKIQRFKTFVDALGNDVDSLRREARAAQRQSEVLVRESNDEKEQRRRLLEEVHVQASNSATLRDDALKLLQKTRSDLRAVQQQSDYFEKQLKENTGALCEERDRRACLERRLEVAGDSRESIEKIKSSSTAALDKLYEMHAELATGQGNAVLITNMSRVFTAVQEFSGQATSTSNEIQLVKGLVEKVEEQLRSQSESIAASKPTEDLVASLRTSMSERLVELRVRFEDHEKLVQQDTVNCEKIKTLQERLEECRSRLAESKSQVSAVESRELQLKDQKTQLLAKVTALQNTSLPNEHAQVRLSETQAKLVTKTTEAQHLADANSGLQQEIETLSARVAEYQNSIASFQLERDDIIHKSKEELTCARQEMSEHVETIRTQLRSESHNELKKITSDRDRATKQRDTLKDELAECKRQVDTLEQNTTSIDDSKQEAARLAQLTVTQKNEIAAHQESIRNLQTAILNSEAVKEKFEALTARFASQEQTLKLTTEDNSSLSKELEEIQRKLRDAQKASQQASTESRSVLEDKDTDISTLKVKLTEAEDALKASESGVDLTKESCNKAIEQDKTKYERTLQALQTRLAEELAEKQGKLEDHERFRNEIEQAHESHQRQIESQQAQARQGTADARIERDTAITNVEKERQKLSVELKEAKSCMERAERKLRAHGIEGVTPPSRKSMDPPQPPKKADRPSTATLEDEPPRAPLSLRSQMETQGRTRRLMSEDSQDVWGEVAGMTRSGHHEDDDMLSVVGGMLQPLSQRASEMQISSQPLETPETQNEEPLPSFAVLNDGLDTSQTFGRPEHSQALSLPTATRASDNDFVAPRSYQAAVDLPRKSQLAEVANSTQEIPTFDDQPAEKASLSRPSLISSQADRRKYEFQKPHPKPNSASKRVQRTHTDSSQGTQQDQPRRTGQRSSSPDFLDPKAVGKRNKSTYHPHFFGGSQRRTSQSQLEEDSQPRVSNYSSQPAPKRKALNQAVDGSKQHQPKRFATGSASNNDNARFNLRSNTQPSINDLPNFNSMPSQQGSSDLSSETSSRSRLRTLGGGNSKAGRVSKRPSKNDEINARFSQELGGR